MEWQFYGRRTELAQLRTVLARDRWFFVRVTGRRRIGKTSLVHRALSESGRDRVLYLQIPDSDAAGVLATAAEFYAMFGIAGPYPTSLSELAESLAGLMRRGYVVAIDEFQYFNRRSLYEFNSHLQFRLDELARDSGGVRGGLIVLGSIHADMVALLEDRNAPLFNRLTDQIELSHLDIASVLEILRAHADAGPARLLMLWNLFEGVPKFYRDCFEQGVIGADRRTLLERMFFLSSSPLRTEADNWFLRELHGRYDTVLKYVATHAGCSHADIMDHFNRLGASQASPLAAYLRILTERYGMIERLQPMFARTNSRTGRYYVRDNFLRTWLAALATPVAARSFRPLPDLLDDAERRLRQSEGPGFERLVRALYEERSRRGLSDFHLSRHVAGWWDRAGTELDFVALDDRARSIRCGTCKLNPDRLAADLDLFEGHISRFLTGHRHLDGWAVEKLALAPELGHRQRVLLADRGYLPQDLSDLCQDL